MNKKILILGERDCGKTTLVNALLGWDTLPQATDCYSFPTKEFTEVPWDPGYTLVDSPGYMAGQGHFPPELPAAIREADKILLVTGASCREDMAAEVRLLLPLLAGIPRKKCFLVIPYAAGDWPQGHPNRALCRLRALGGMGSLVGWNLNRIFCVESMAGLIASIEADPLALARTGIPALRAALRRE